MDNFLKKHKNKLLAALFLIVLPWAFVLYLELKINNQSLGSLQVLGDGVCLKVPTGCSFQKTSHHRGILCKDGSVVTIVSSAAIPQMDNLTQIKAFKTEKGEVKILKEPAQSGDSRTTYWIDTPMRNFKGTVLYKSKNLSFLGDPDNCMAYYK